MSFQLKNPRTRCTQQMGLHLKDNANNVYMDNVDKRGTFGGIRLIGLEETGIARATERDISVTDLLAFSIKPRRYVHSVYDTMAHK